ncbi:hypothetical protein [Flavobacterium sp.]|uniref:hypothetical protein n=1 Tax=Flavobacterium sp. TaxID=239 RepID=UPI003529B835
MLLNTTHHNKKTEALINEKVGKPFGLIDNFKLRGIGSPRLDIQKTSKAIEQLLNRDNHRQYGNIELRPKGILFRFHTRLETYALVIPYYKLVLYKPGNSFTIYIDNHFVNFSAIPTNKAIYRFIQKMKTEQQKLLPNHFIQIL